MILILKSVSFVICVRKFVRRYAIVMTNNFELAQYTRDKLFKDMEWLDQNDQNIRKVNRP